MTYQVISDDDEVISDDDVDCKGSNTIFPAGLLILALVWIYCNLMNVSVLEGACKHVKQINTPHATGDTAHADSTAVCTQNCLHHYKALLLMKQLRRTQHSVTSHFVCYT
jgi:hypothetical protein